MSQPDLITFTPDPPTWGQPVKICIKFRDGDPSPRNLTVEFQISGGTTVSMSIEVSESFPCETVVVPTGAISMLISDPAGISAPAGGSCTP